MDIIAPNQHAYLIPQNKITMKKVRSIPTLRGNYQGNSSNNGSSQLHIKALRRAQSCNKITTRIIIHPDSPEAIVQCKLGVKRPNPSHHLFRASISEGRIDAFTNEKVDAVRNNDVETLRRLHQQGENLDACSKNGESLLHLACRRGNIETVEFLLQVVPTTIQDELGRTVLHDVCWRPRPDPALLLLILNAVPQSFILTTDARGHTCFDYCRKHDWPLWNAFLEKNLTNVLENEEKVDCNPTCNPLI